MLPGPSKELVNVGISSGGMYAEAPVAIMAFENRNERTEESSPITSNVLSPINLASPVFDDK